MMMGNYRVPEIDDGVFAVGVKDWNRRLFDALIPLPEGTTYNAYIVKGSRKTALIDTVDPGFEEELTRRIAEVADPTKLDYVVMNHAEPDHAGSVPHMLALSPEAKLVTSIKGADLAVRKLGVPKGRIEEVVDGNEIDLGGKTLRFLDAPMLHWPETMFTYLPEEAVLFPCDFFGAHVTYGRFDADVDELVGAAKRYFGEIMMPFRKMGAKAMEKVALLDLKVIAPSHGPVYRCPERILAPYRKWTAGETAPKALAAYVSMYGSTERYVKTIVDVLESCDIQVALHDVCVADLGDLACDLVDSRALVLGTPTVLNGMHPLMFSAANVVKALAPPLQYAVAISSYGWSTGGLKQAREVLESAKLEIVGTFESGERLSAEKEQELVDLAELLAARMKG